MKKSTKIFVMLLTLAILVGTLVVSAFAADTNEAKIGDTEYATLKDAIAALNTDEGENTLTVTLLTNLTLTENVEISRTSGAVEIDLNGKNVNIDKKYGFKTTADGVSIADTSYYVTDYDFKSGDGAFFPISFYVQTCVDKTQGDQGSIGVKADGTIGNKKLDLDTWYHMTVVLQVIRDADGNVTGSLTKYYVNGEYVGEKSGHISESTASGSFFGLCAHIGAGTSLSEGMAFCLDNAVTTFYGNNYTDAAVLFTSENKSLDSWSDAYYNSAERDVVKDNPAAAINNVTYDSVEEALSQVTDGDTLYLFEDVDRLVNVDKAITVITNCKFDYTSETHKVTVIPGGYKFETAKSNEIVEVFFVNSLNPNDYTSIKLAHGNQIVYNGQLNLQDTIDYVNGSVSAFVGWTTDPAAENPEIVTQFPTVGPEHSSMLVYYSVFETTYPDFVLTDSNGNYVKSGSASEFEAVAEAMTSGQKITLLKDIELDTVKVEIVASGSYYFDLNGHSILDTFLAASKSPLFRPQQCSLYIYSSRQGATITIKASDNAGKGAPLAEAHTNSKVYIGDVGENAGKGYGDNLTVYAASIIDTTHRTGTGYIGGGTYVRVIPDYAGFITARVGVIYASNATFYSSLTEASVLVHTTANTSVASFDNCTFVAKLQKNGNPQKLMNTFAEGATVTLNDCTLANVVIDAATVNNGSLTLTGVNKLMSAAPDYATVEAGYELLKYNHTFEVLGVEFTALYVLTDSTNAIDVTWKNADGSEIMTEKYAVGGNAVYSGASLDIVTNVYTRRHTGWDVSCENLATDTVLTAVYENAITADIKGVKHNMTITDNLDLNIYVPADNAIASISISTDSNRADIKGEIKGGYYVITRPYDPDKISVEFVLCVTVKVGDFEDVYEIRASVLSYATNLLESQQSDQDKGLIMDMLVYANEAHKYFSGSDDAAVKAVIDNADYSAYINAHGFDLTGKTAKDMSALSFALHGARLSLTSTPAFVFSVADGYTGNVTVSADFLAEALTLTPDSDGNVWLRGIFYKNLGADIVITVTGESGNVSAVYNLQSYALSEDTDCSALSLALAIFQNTAKNYQ